MEATWKPHEKHGELTERSNLPDSVFAFPKQRKEPMTDASHVRNAIARFDQTIGVSDEDRKLAFANIKKAAGHYGVDERGRLEGIGQPSEHWPYRRRPQRVGPEGGGHAKKKAAPLGLQRSAR
jgi:Family of unknown function (DUF6582)